MRASVLVAVVLCLTSCSADAERATPADDVANAYVRRSETRDDAASPPREPASYPFVWLTGTDQWEPEYFALVLDDTIRVLGGADHRVTSDSIVIRVPEHNRLDAALAASYDSGVIIYYQFSSGGSGAAGAVFVDLSAKNVVWQTEHVTGNLGEPAIRAGNLYVSGHGLVASIHIDNGRINWEQDGLYDRGTFNSFQAPEFVGDTVIFRDSRGSDAVRVLDATGQRLH